MADLNISITPAQIEYVIKPGASIIQAYKVRNDSGNPLFLSTSVEEWQAQGSDGLVSYQNVEPSSNIEYSFNNSDLKLGEVFVLQPKTERQIVLKVKAKDTSPLGDVYSTFFITQNSNATPEPNQASANGKIGSHILLSVSNSETNKTEGEIINFHSSPKLKDIILNDVSFQAQIKNNSSYFYKINGNITISKNGLEIKKIDLSPLNVLSHQTRQILCTNQSTSETANCKIEAPLWPGKYTATINPSENLNIKPFSISFFVFPFSFIFLLLILVSSITIYTLLNKQKGKNYT